MNPTLDEWHAEPRHRYADPATPGNLVLVGTVKGHPKKADGTVVRTSPVVASETQGRLISTQSGTIYEVLQPATPWVDWMAAEGIPFDPDNPIRIIDYGEPDPA